MASEHDELREQAGLYVLGALDAGERAAFEAHLASCAVCAAEVDSLSTVAGALVYAVPQTDPAPGLRARVMASVAGPSSPRRLEKASAAPGGVGAMGAGAVVAVTTPGPWLAAAAALVIAVGLGVYAAQLRGRIADIEGRLRDATERAQATEAQVAELRRTAAGAETQVSVLAAPDLARIDLTGQPTAPSATARAFWSRSRGLVFTASQLPALPPGRVYQLWVVTAQMPISAGLLQPDATGRVNIVVITPADIPQPTAIAVTDEPAGGVPAPTGNRYLVGLAN